MDLCKYCNKLVSITLFCKDKRSKKGYVQKCIECRREYGRQHRKRSDRERTNSEKKKDVVRLAKSLPCSDCTVLYPYYVMDLDHLPGYEKKFNPSRTREHSLPELIEEIKKCEPVCSNCHRIRTHNRGYKGGRPKV